MLTDKTLLLQYHVDYFCTTIIKIPHKEQGASQNNDALPI